MHRRAVVILKGTIQGVVSARGDYARARILLGTHSKWKTLGAVFLGHDGRFKYFWRPQSLGVARLRVIYVGGARYLPTQATRSIRVMAR